MAFWVLMKRTKKLGEVKRSIMVRVYSFDSEVHMLRNISAPFLNALDVDPASTLSDSW